MIKISQKAKDWLARQQKEKRDIYVLSQASFILQFEGTNAHWELPPEHKYRHQIEICLDSNIFRSAVERECNRAEEEARRLLTHSDHKEGRDFFVGSYVNEEIIDFGVLMVQVKDPKWIMVLKLAF